MFAIAYIVQITLRNPQYYIAVAAVRWSALSTTLPSIICIGWQSGEEGDFGCGKSGVQVLCETIATTKPERGVEPNIRAAARNV